MDSARFSSFVALCRERFMGYVEPIKTISFQSQVSFFESQVSFFEKSDWLHGVFARNYLVLIVTQ